MEHYFLLAKWLNLRAAALAEHFKQPSLSTSTRYHLGGVAVMVGILQAGLARELIYGVSCQIWLFLRKYDCRKLA